MQSGFQLGDHLWLQLQFLIPFQHGPPHVIVKGVEIWGIWWPTVLLNDLSHSCVTRAVCVGAPSCWKMNPAGINCLQSLISLISILCTGMHELLLLLRIPVHAASAFTFCPHATPFPF